MKTKLTFVTNSSTCSFVFLGFELLKNNISYKDLIDYIFPGNRSKMEVDWKEGETQQLSLPFFTDDDYKEMFQEGIWSDQQGEFEVLDDTEQGAPNDNVFLIGFTLMSVDEYEISEGMTVRELTEVIDDVKKIKSKMGFQGDIKLYGSIKMC